MIRPLVVFATIAALSTLTQAGMFQQSQSNWGGQGGGYSSSSSSSSHPGGQGSFSSFGSSVANSLPLLVRILVRRGSVSNLSQGSGQLTFFNDATGIHIVANGQHFDSNDLVGPYVVSNENGPLVRREYTAEDSEFEERQRSEMRDNWNRMDDNFAANWKSFPAMKPIPPMQPMQPMQPFRMRSLF